MKFYKTITTTRIAQSSVKLASKMSSQGAAHLRIEDIQILGQPQCKIKDKVHVQSVINELRAGGLRKLQVVTDYDHTITKQKMVTGRKALTSFGMLNTCRNLPKSYLDAYAQLDDQYRPLEHDPSIPMAEKFQFMIEWWRKSGELLVGFPLDPNEIDEIAHKYCDSLRDGTQELFQDLNKLNVPLLVFSAGLGDCVVSVLKQSKILLPNVKVISNFLRYGKDNVLEGLNEPIIHTFNKNETVLKGTEYYNIVRDRDHVIVMGDSLGDAGMATGVPSSLNVLKIGFLFDHVEQNLSKYMDSFDIVLVDDQTMDVPRAILSLIEQNSQ